jgi:hypothetical protein
VPWGGDVGEDQLRVTLRLRCGYRPLTAVTGVLPVGTPLRYTRPQGASSSPRSFQAGFPKAKRRPKGAVFVSSWARSARRTKFLPGGVFPYHRELRPPLSGLGTEAGVGNLAGLLHRRCASRHPLQRPRAAQRHPRTQADSRIRPPMVQAFRASKPPYRSYDIRSRDREREKLPYMQGILQNVYEN